MLHGAFFRMLEHFNKAIPDTITEPDQPRNSEKYAIPQKHSSKILVADDQVINQIIAERIFNTLGIQPDIASNGLEVLRQCESQHYDMVFMDINMPEMDGIEATRELHKKFPGGKRPVVVAMTANSMEGDRETCLEAGMDDFLPKPLRIDELQKILMRYENKK